MVKSISRKYRQIGDMLCRYRNHIALSGLLVPGKGRLKLPADMAMVEKPNGGKRHERYFNETVT